MAETLKKLDPGFSVADAEPPRLVYDENDLSVVFIEWTEREIELRFPNCYAVRWQTAFVHCPEERDDEVCEVMGSAWLALHRDQQAIAPQEPTRHFKLNFNAFGQLEVLADKMILVRKGAAPEK